MWVRSKKMCMLEGPYTILRRRAIGIFHLMKVVFVQLPHKTGEVGVSEESRENDFGELGGIVDDEPIALWSPG